MRCALKNEPLNAIDHDVDEAISIPVEKWGDHPSRRREVGRHEASANDSYADRIDANVAFERACCIVLHVRWTFAGRQRTGRKTEARTCSIFCSRVSALVRCGPAEIDS
jgi:hypothetical protein